jgi:hypothetical protein
LKKGKVSLGELPGTASYGSEEITHIWERARSERYYVQYRLQRKIEEVGSRDISKINNLI